MAFISGRPFLFKNVLFACLILFPASNCLEDSTMGNRLNISSSPSGLDSSMKDTLPLPVDSVFSFPSSLPQWPSGLADFASGTIDLGGLLVSQVSNFTKVWSTGNNGATFFEPSSVPNGFFMLGSYAQPNNVPLFGWVLVGRDVSGGSLKKPSNYSLVWSSENSTKTRFDSSGYIWLPVCPDGYEAVGYLVTNMSQKPSLDKIRCVRADFTNVSETNDWIWGVDGVNIYNSRPKYGGIQSPAVPTGSFIVHTDSNSSLVSPACLRNTNNNFSAMPNLTQIQALMKSYSPIFRFHPDEAFYPSSVTWFFQNGALLYSKANESKPVPVEPSGANLPQNGSCDGAYWLDLPTNNADRDKVKKGSIQNSSAYLHVKPVFGATFTDIAVWLFYPFNGAARARLGLLTIDLGKIGEHVGDWEHVTLRISNFNGVLTSVFFSQHARGVWVSAPQLEFQNGTNKPIVYSSKHGHAAYPEPGENLLGTGDIKIRNDAAKGGLFMDTGLNFTVISAENLGKDIAEPLWLNYARQWGPHITYDYAKELKNIKGLEKFVSKLPSEIMGEDGPTGPKCKANWSGDEVSWK